MRGAHTRYLLPLAPMLIALVASSPAASQTCPTAGTPLSKIDDAIVEYHRNGRAPAGADCAYQWAMGQGSETSVLSKDYINLFREASFIQRQAASMRRNASQREERVRFLEQEIEIRTKFLNDLLQSDAVAAPESHKRLIVSNISFLASALGEASQYERLAIELGKQDPDYLDAESVNVWLRAVWSCAQWDGKKSNVVAAGTCQACKTSIETLLLSVEQIEARKKLPPATRVELGNLRAAYRKSQECSR